MLIFYTKTVKFVRSFKKHAGRAGISVIEIERYPNQVLVNIHTARPGIVIGRKGEAVKQVKAVLEEKTGKKVKVEVTEIEKPDLDATLVAKQHCRTTGTSYRS